jgi:hypothetical protein
MDWSRIASNARTGFERGVNEWILRARVGLGRIQGPNAEITPGSLSSDVNFEPTLRDGMTATGAPSLVSQFIARELAGAWKEWADGFRMSLPGAFPGFAAFPGPQAPPTRSARASYPLSMGSSAGEHRLRAISIQTRLASALRASAGREASEMETEVRRLANWIDLSVRDWMVSAQVIELMGGGPTPTWAPPYVPVGPVIVGSGHNSAAPGRLAGPRFGKAGF